MLPAVVNYWLDEQERLLVLTVFALVVVLVGVRLEGTLVGHVGQVLPDKNGGIAYPDGGLWASKQDDHAVPQLFNVRGGLALSASFPWLVGLALPVLRCLRAGPSVCSMDACTISCTPQISTDHYGPLCGAGCCWGRLTPSAASSWHVLHAIDDRL